MKTENNVSIRASLQQRGEPTDRNKFAYDLSSFNPRLTSAARRTQWECREGDQHLVSIRASLQQRGEPPPLDGLAHHLTVSIRASLQQRGERRAESGFPSGLSCFNPRLTSAARRTLYLWRLRNLGRVSIRASLQQRGELARPDRGCVGGEVSIRASLQQRGER